MRAILISALFALFLFQGCFQQIAVGSLTGIMEDGFAVMNEESDLQLAEASIGSNLKLIESVIRGDPGNRELLQMACTGYSSYAMAFVEDQDPARARVFYLRAKDFGLRLFPPASALGKALRGDPAGLTDALGRAPASDVPAVFWTALSWGGAISLDLTDPDGLADLPRVQAMMEWVRSKDPGYFYGGADFFLGTLAGSRPVFLGGDSAASREHFERALELSRGHFLLTYVYYARTYAVQVQDSALFGRLLTAVDTASVDILPEARLSNVVAKKKAALLRASINERF
jgi:hypothetical protein